MIERMNEGLVVQAARDWAVRINKSDANAVANAQETMVVLKIKLTIEESDRALEKLYLEHDES